MALSLLARRPRLLLLGIGAFLASGTACTTIAKKRPVTPAPPLVYRAEPGRAWDVVAGGETTGRVVLFVSKDSPDRSVYVVRNLYGQDLGWIDHLGRAYRLLPHQEDPAWVGTGTVAGGAEQILGTKGPCTLAETPLPGSPEEPSRVDPVR